MRLRLATALTAAGLALISPYADAAVRDQVIDVKGDVRGGDAGMDILSARYGTTGRGASKALVVSMTLASAPKTERPFSYELRNEIRGCGTVQFDYAAAPLADELGRLNQPSVHDGSLAVGVWFECMHGAPGPADSSGSLHEEVGFTIKGNTMTWSVPFSLLPELVQPGAVFHDFDAIADIGEPVFGLPVLGNSGQSLDYGRGDGVWIMR